MTTIVSDERRAFLREIGRRGGLKRAEAFTSEYRRMARACVRHESNVANGREGGIAFVKKHGKRKLVEQARQYRIAHPSELERIVAGALQEIGATKFEREAYIFPRSRVHLITGDFVFRRAHKVVYAGGAAWHCGKALHPSLAECADCAMRDERFDNYLRHRGWRVLRLSETEIREHARGDGGAMLKRLRGFLQVRIVIGD